MNTVGQILSIERNSKNLSISDIVIELKISKSIIIDLENDNIKNNPDIIFNRVLLPSPVSPTMATFEPKFTSIKLLFTMDF